MEFLNRFTLTLQRIFSLKRTKVTLYMAAVLWLSVITQVLVNRAFFKNFQIAEAFVKTSTEDIECSLEICPNVNIVLDIAKKISGTISLPNKELAPKGGIMISVSASDGAGNSGSSFVTIPYNTNCSTYTVKVPANSLGSGYRVSYGIITSQEKYMDYIYYSVSGATTSYSKATLVDVSSSSATGIDVELMPAKIISGRISLPNGDVAPEGGIRIIVSAINEAGNNGSSSVTIPCGENSATYTVNVPAKNPEDGYRITYFVLTP